jgi:uncharacterized iron-regulated membrane protein
MLASNGSKKTWLRRVHAIIGVISSVNLLVMLASGLLMQHRETFGLEDRVVSRTFLPTSYRINDRNEGVRADIVVTDLHSGRLFGPIGLVVLDIVTLSWAVLLLSGIFMFTSKQLRLRVDERTKIAMAVSHKKPQKRAISSVGVER